MPQFRFFTLDALGRIDRGLERECRHAEEAMRFARTLVGAACVEVWQGQRMIARINPS
jgi:hypothetical protein